MLVCALCLLSLALISLIDWVGLRPNPLILIVYIANTYTIIVACIYLINKQYIMLQVKKQVDVVCSAIGIKEAMTMCPITTLMCDGIRFGNGITFNLSYKQRIAIGKLLGELGFVNERGENPLELIQNQNIEESEQCPECPE